MISLFVLMIYINMNYKSNMRMRLYNNLDNKKGYNINFPRNNNNK